jgi:hypothetical protein
MPVLGMPPDNPRSSTTDADDAKAQNKNPADGAASAQASPLDRGTRTAVQASLRYHGRKR